MLYNCIVIIGKHVLTHNRRGLDSEKVVLVIFQPSQGHVRIRHLLFVLFKVTVASLPGGEGVTDRGVRKYWWDIYAEGTGQ